MNEKELLRASIERLEAEKQRRIDEKVAKGEAVLVPLERDSNGMVVPIVTGVPPRDDETPYGESYRARKVAELRAAGETRPIYFEEPAEDDICVIVTGVPRSGREWDEDYVAATAANSKGFSAPAPEDSPTAPKIPPPRSPQDDLPERPESTPPRYVRAQVRRPDPERNDPGEIAEGSYTISGNSLRVEDKQGRTLGSQMLKPGDNVEAAAQKILREKHGHHNSFYDPIPYGRV